MAEVILASVHVRSWKV